MIKLLSVKWCTEFLSPGLICYRQSTAKRFFWKVNLRTTLLQCQFSPSSSLGCRPSVYCNHIDLFTERKRKNVCFLAPSQRYISLLSAKSLIDAAPSSVQPYLRLMRVDKPTGTWLLYLPCTWSIALAAPAASLPDFRLLALFGVGSFLMRSAGCIINDLWDKDFDRLVERTKSRPLACGELSSRQAVALLGGLLSLALTVLLQLNWYSVFLGASSLSLVVLYPLAKRYTYWPQVVLGITLNWGVLVAWIELNNSLGSLVHALPLYCAAICHTVIFDTIYSHQCMLKGSILFLPSALNFCRLTFNWGCLLGYSAATGSCFVPIVLPLYVAGISWTMIYDTIYAHQDKSDDLIVGVKSTALRFGDQTKAWLSLFAFGMVGSLSLAGFSADQTLPFYGGLGLVAAHLVWQIATVKINNAEDCWRKFKSNHYLGLFVFLIICAGTLARSKQSEVQLRNSSTDK